jgi:predicted PurR-regulated permease PerM
MSGFAVLASVLVFGALLGVIGAIIAVPIAAALQIVFEELTAGRRARIAAADAAVRDGSVTAEASPVEVTIPVGA